MAKSGILDSLFGGNSTEVQIPTVPAPKPKAEDGNPFDIERAKAGQGRFPPQSELFVNTARTSGHLTNIALATLIGTSGYTLQQVQDLWSSGDISDRSTYIVLTHGILPPRETLRYVYSAELLSTQIQQLPKSNADTEAVRYVEQGQSFVVNAPQGFHVYVFCSGPSLVEGRTLPEELGSGQAAITLQVQRHTLSATKSDNSVDHTFTFTQRVVALTKDFPQMASGVLRFIARAELIRI
jgi:hypothetical protein